MTGTGIGFDFSQLMTQFAALDNQLRALTDKGELFGKSMRDALKNMGQDELDKFVKQLTNLRHQIVGSKKDDIFGFGKQKMLMNWDSTSLQNYINDVNRLIMVIKALQAEGKGAGMSTKGLQITGLRKEIKEAQELLAIIKKVEQQTKRSTYDRNTSYAGATNYSNNAVSIEQNAKAVEYLTAARNKLKTTDADYLTKLEDLNTRIQKHNEILHRSKQTNREAADEAKKTADATKRANDQMLRTPAELVGMKGSAKTMNELRLYAEQLRKTMNTLNPKSAEWQKLNGILQQTEKQISRVENKMKGINGISGTLKNALSGVGRMFATAFAVERLWQYSKAIVSVTGEFEQMQVALKTIIGNTEDANRIWGQTMALAKNSPFQARELVKYTRQLAAYRIETDKLHDTTKMLADVSAGLGVDMSRLILAYGQVRAAEYLRGTELRQFTEAGVPMLEELAKHLSELEGRAVSTADAFEMISKRQVAFSDVNAVLEKMTSEGGPFYKMQEVMSDTIKGSISNLKDEVDLMMYEIGQSNSGIIKGTLNLLRSLVRNWEYVGATIKTVTVALVTYKLAAKSAALSSFTIKGAWDAIKASVVKATAAVKGFLTSIGPIGWALTIISTIVTAVLSYRAARRDANKEDEKAAELASELERIKKKYEEVTNSVEKLSLAFGEASNSGNISEMTVQLNRLIELAKQEYSLVIDVEIQGASEEDLKGAFNDVKKIMTDAGMFANRFQEAWEQKDPNRASENPHSFYQIEKELFELWRKDYASIQNHVKQLIAAKDEYSSLFHEFVDGEDPVEYMYEYYNNLLDISRANGNKEFYAMDKLNLVYSYKSRLEAYLSEIKKEMGFSWDFTGVNLTAALTQLIEGEEIRPEAKLAWQKKMEEFFGTEMSPVISDDSMSQWELDFNKHLETLRENTLKAIDKAGLSDKNIGDKLRLNGIVIESLQADNKKSREELVKTLKEARDIRKAILDAIAAGSKAYTDEEAKIAQIEFDQYDASIKWLEGNQSKGGKNRLEEANKKRIDLLKKMNSQYIKEFKHFGVDAEKEIRDAYEKAFGEVFKGIKIDYDDIDFTSASGMAKSLERLRPQAKKAGKDAVAALEEEIARFKSEIKIQAKIELDTATIDSVESYINRFEFSAELQELNVDPELAKSLFDIEYLTWDELRKSVVDTFTSAEALMVEAKILGDEITSTYKGNANILEQSMTDASKFIERGWAEENVGKDPLSMYASYFKVTGADKKSVGVLINPMLPDGTIMTPADVSKYVREKLNEAEDILAADKNNLNIVIGVGFPDEAVARKEFNAAMAEYRKLLAEAKGDQAILVPELAKSFEEIDWGTVFNTVGEDQGKKIKEKLEEIYKLQTDKNIAEAKEFVNFLKKNLGEIERIQNKGAYNISLSDRLFGEGKITAEQYVSAVRNIIQSTNDEVQRVNFEKFKEGSTYIKAMGNLAAYSRSEIKTMIDELEQNVGTNAGAMGLDEVQAYYSAIANLTKQYEDIRNPFVFADSQIAQMVQYTQLQKELNTAKENEKTTAERRLAIEKEIVTLQATLAQQQADGNTDAAASTQEDIKKKVGELEQVNGELAGFSTNITTISERISNLSEGMTKGLFMAQKIVNEISNIANATTEAFNGIKDAADALGADTDSGGWAKASIAMDMVGGVTSDLSNGLTALASGNIFGVISSLIGMVTKLISGFAKMGDQQYIDQIEDQKKVVENLSSAYEALERATEKAFSVEAIKENSDALIENIELQKIAYQNMITAEQSKKNTDQSQIDAWNEEIAKLDQQIEDVKKDLASGVGAVAEDEFRSQTRSFVDAWVSAYKETGDGLSGLKEEFSNFFDDILAEQATLKVTDAFLKPFYETLNSYLEDFEVTTAESASLREQADAIMPELSAALEQIWAALGGGGGTSSGSLSELQKGIQGVTEETAQVLESLLNSMRLYVADTNMHIKDQTDYIKKMWKMMDDSVNGMSPFYVQMKTI